MDTMKAIKSIKMSETAKMRLLITTWELGKKQKPARSSSTWSTCSANSSNTDSTSLFLTSAPCRSSINSSKPRHRGKLEQLGQLERHRIMQYEKSEQWESALFFWRHNKKSSQKRSQKKSRSLSKSPNRFLSSQVRKSSMEACLASSIRMSCHR